MNRPQFKGRKPPRLIRPPATPNHSRWIQLPESGLLPDSKSRGRKRIFAIASRPIPADDEGKTTRRILIFDNHPATIRLLNNLPGTEFSRPDRKIAYYFFVSIVLVLAVLVGMLLPVL